MTWLIIAGVAYLLLFSGRSTSISSLAQRAAQISPTVVTRAGTFTAAIPGIGSYTNVDGGQSVAVTLDGSAVQTIAGLLGAGQ